MAHKKAGGSTRNGRDSESKRLGVKRVGRDHTLFATADGHVQFARKGPQKRRVVSIQPAD